MTDWHVFFEALKDINYSGVVSIEYEASVLWKLFGNATRYRRREYRRLAADAIIKKYAK